MTNRRTVLSPYERQLKPGDALATFLFIGTNLTANWTTGNGAYDLNYFPATYSLPLRPTVAVSTGARGNSIVANAPKRCVRKWQFNVFDYDEELYDQFKSWLDGRTELRVYAWGDFMTFGHLSGIPLKRPRAQSMLVDFNPTAVYIVEPTMPDINLMDFSTSHHSFSGPFNNHLASYGVDN